jgi:hypothetical protein
MFAVNHLSMRDKRCHIGQEYAISEPIWLGDGHPKVRAVSGPFY